MLNYSIDHFISTPLPLPFPPLDVTFEGSNFDLGTFGVA